MSSRARAAGSVLLRHLGQRVSGGPAAPSPAAAMTTPLLAGRGERQLHSMSMISASEARADVAEVYASKNNYASLMSAKAELALISAAEARADVAEVYASKEKDGEWKDKDNAAVPEVRKP